MLWHIDRAAAQGVSCVRPPKPLINVNIAEDPVYFNLDKSKAELEAFKTEANSGHLPSNYHAEVGGVMSGRFKADYDVSFHSGEEAGIEQKCVAIKSIDVFVELEPTIYIASELAEHECWFKEVFAHESKHVEVDRDVAGEYAVKITEALHFAFMNPQDYTFTEVPENEVITAQIALRGFVEGAIGAMFGSMLRARQDAQLQIDTLEEYVRIANSCPAIEQERVTPTPMPVP